MVSSCERWEVWHGVCRLEDVPLRWKFAMKKWTQMELLEAVQPLPY